nr:V-set and transmembrane domain-containing protein 5 isoform X2 [Loxodonta africana]
MYLDPWQLGTQGVRRRNRNCQGISLYIPQSAINATVKEDILLSVEYSCLGVPTIEWKYTSNWGVQKIVEWKPGTQANISQSHKDRVCTFDNGSIQLFSVGVSDSGYYIITVTERLGSSQFGTIVLHVSGKTGPGAWAPLWAASVWKADFMILRDVIFPFPSPPPLEILYEDLHFVAVFLAFLAAVAAVLISLMWVCNKCAYKFQRKRRHKLKGNCLGLVIIHAFEDGGGTHYLVLTEKPLCGSSSTH